MREVDKSRDHLQPPKVFGRDTPIYELFEQQHQFLEALTTELTRLIPEGDNRRIVKGLLENYQSNVEEILNRRDVAIFNGRGEHSRMEALIRHRALEQNGYGDEVVDPYPMKEESSYPLLEGLIRDLILPRSKELLFSNARQKLPDDVRNAPRGIYEASANEMTLILRPKGQIVRFSINNKSHISPVVLERTTLGNEVFMRENVESMIHDLFALIDSYECLKHSPNVKDSLPITKDFFLSVLKMNLPANFGGEDQFIQPLGFKGLCLKPLTSLSEVRESLNIRPVQLRMCFREDCCRDSMVFLFRIDKDSFLAVDSSLEIRIHHYSEKERAWVSVSQHFPYIPYSDYQDMMADFFGEYGHKPRYKAG